MASKWKDGKTKQHPVLLVGFRMVVEKLISKFLESSEESLAFPKYCEDEERCFIEEMCYKLGLKTKLIRTESRVYVVAFKNDPPKETEPLSEIQLTGRSLNHVVKMLELLGQVIVRNTVESEKQSNGASIGSVASYKSSVISVPPPAKSTPYFLKARQKLGIFSHRDVILDLMKQHQIIIVQCTTGSGKSTQIPQYILEDSHENNRPCRIIVAEPKRICATSLAVRVSAERCEAVGSTVGYQVRLESKVAPTSNLIYVTNGVILRMLMSGQPQEFFQSVTTLILDEVHERDMYSDFLMLCVRQFASLNPNLRVIIMSATIDSNLFAEYFSRCPVLSVECQSFAIEEVFLEDILKLLKFSNNEVQSLKSDLGKNPQLFDKQASSSDNMDDDTKDAFNGVLEKISTSTDCDSDFHKLFDLVQAEKAPVDYRHSKTDKTALMFAVEYQFEAHVLKLLSLKADPTLTALVDGREMSSSDMAVETKNEKIMEMINRAMELLQGTASAVNIQGELESSFYDRKLMDIYYDTQVQPGINRGVFLEDAVDLKLIMRLVRHLHYNTDPSKGILVFLPGHEEIIQLANLLYNTLDMNYEIFILHSQLQTMDQATVFEQMPEGNRKIVIATNIAESSITVNDISFVIDCGKEKRLQFNAATHVFSLRSQWISKASAKQRMGRAGRLSDGAVFRIYSRDRYAFLDENPKPEFLRCDLTDLCLQAKMIAPNETIREFLSKAVTPPTDLTITSSLKLLTEVGALNADQAITPLGLYLADVPLNAMYGKMLFYALVFKCIDPVLTLVSILSTSDPFVMPFNDDARRTISELKRKLEDGSYSDHFVLLKLFQKWNEYKTRKGFDGGFCEDNHVSSATLERIAATRLKIVGYLRSARLIQTSGNMTALNVNSHSWPVIKACLAAGTYPKVARINKRRGELRTMLDQKLFLNQRSVLHAESKNYKNHYSSFPSCWMIFEEKNLHGGYASAKVCSLVTDFCLIIAAGGSPRVHKINVTEEPQKPVDDSLVELEIDGLIRFTARSETAFAFQDIRERLNEMMGRLLMNVEKFRSTENDEILIEGIVKLLELEDEAAGFKIKFDQIGARPRVITREFNAPREQNRPTNNKPCKENRPPKKNKKQPEVSTTERAQQNVSTPTRIFTNVTIYHADGTVEQKIEGALVQQETEVEPQESPSPVQQDSPTKQNAIRHLMVELDSPDLAKLLKGKVIVRMAEEAKLPSVLLDSLIDMEIKDYESKKVLIFHSDTKIVGCGMLMNFHGSQVKQNDLKMFFQGEGNMELSTLKSLTTDETYGSMFKKPFAEVPTEIGQHCVEVCVGKATAKQN